MIKLLKGDCLIESAKIKSGSVDLILTDLPYGTMNGLNYKEQIKYRGVDSFKWDNIIDTNKIMEIANRILRKNGKMILFSKDPFSTELKNKAISNLPYSYSMIWEKDNYGHALFAKKAPLNYYEDVLVFSKNNETIFKHPLRDYATKILNFINKKSSEISKELQIGKIHFLSRESNQLILPTKEVYQKIVDFYNLECCCFYKNYSDLKEIENNWKNQYSNTFNLWENNKHKSNILKYKKDYNGYHPTQKPVLLLEDLIKTFSNKNDLVVDLTMGSGSTLVACQNTNRNGIGIELNESYFNIAKKRIKETQRQTKLF